VRGRWLLVVGLLLGCMATTFGILARGWKSPESGVAWLRQWADITDAGYGENTLPRVITRRRDGAVMVLVPAGSYEGGCRRGAWQHGGGCPDDQERFSGEVKSVYVDMDEVSIDKFGRFVVATGYVTDAERSGSSSAVRSTGMWGMLQGRNWRTPSLGSKQVREGSMAVTHVSMRDAAAYAAWVGCSLPREVLFEYLLREGRRDSLFPWGDAWPPSVGGENVCDAQFSAEWPGAERTASGFDDGFAGLAPEASGLADHWGLRNVAGNVSEWCTDMYGARVLGWDEHARTEVVATERYVIRGGSWASPAIGQYLCSYRRGYPYSAHDDTVGFRCVMEIDGRNSSK
jgi:sulfatase modifying factor 1